MVALYYGGLNEKYVDFLRKNVYILFQKDPPLKLIDDECFVNFK